MSNTKLIDAVYQVGLGRAPTAIEAAFWAGELSMNSAYDRFIANVAYSAEARIRIFHQHYVFVPPGHYLSPIVNIREVQDLVLADAEFVEPHVPAVTIDGGKMLEFWRSSVALLKDCRFPSKQSAMFRYYDENPAFGCGDASILYLMLRKHQPRRVVEVGSGFSSACILDTVDQHNWHDVSLTFIDPFPERLRSVLRHNDSARVRIIEAPVQKVDLANFTALEKNDILFIDSTHVVKTGSDVNHEIFNILPYLAEGVLIHFHDIFFPFEYPSEWVLKENRSWNEAYLLRALLMDSDAFEIVFFNDYFQRFYRGEIETTHPSLLKNPGCGIWLRKCSQALSCPPAQSKKE